MTTFESPEVEIATLKARNAKLLLDLADLDHILRMHALHGLADARQALEKLREKVAGAGHDSDPAFGLIDVQLADVVEKLTERKCSCSRTERVALALAEEPEPGKVVPLRKVAVVRKPVRDLLAKVLGLDDEPEGGGAA